MNLYISSSDYIYFENPNEVTSHELELISGKNYLRITLKEPVISDGNFSTKDEAHYEFYLLSRYQKNDLIELRNFPIAVYVLYLPDEQQKDVGNFQNIAWANLYNKYEDSLNYQEPYTNSILNKIIRIFQ